MLHEKKPWAQFYVRKSAMDDEATPSQFQFAAWGKGAWRNLIDFIVPPKCLTCREPVLDPASLCLACWGKLKNIEAPVCNIMGTPFAYDQGAGAISAAALTDPPNWDRARAAVAYDEASRGLVHALKYRDTMEAGLFMARMMGRAGRELVADADIIIPVPLHRWRLWSRRFNQAAFLSQHLARSFGKPSHTDVLLRRKPTKSQVGLKQDERRKNVAKAFEVSPDGVSHLAGAKVLLVDDVMTTGATAGTCATVLKAAGAAQVDVLTFALVISPSRSHIG
jgi:ComF family protein